MAHDTQVAKASPSTNHRSPRTGAERMRLYRQRRERHLRCVGIELGEREIDTLIQYWGLSPDDRESIPAIRQALYRYFDDSLT
jgi:hypothetical protein